MTIINIIINRIRFQLQWPLQQLKVLELNLLIQTWSFREKNSYFIGLILCRVVCSTRKTHYRVPASRKAYLGGTRTYRELNNMSWRTTIAVSGVKGSGGDVRAGSFCSADFEHCNFHLSVWLDVFSTLVFILKHEFKVEACSQMLKALFFVLVVLLAAKNVLQGVWNLFSVSHIPGVVFVCVLLRPYLFDLYQEICNLANNADCSKEGIWKWVDSTV